MYKEPTIKFAIDKISGEVLDASAKFKSAKEAHAVREQYNRGLVDLYCCECGQPLHISKSRFDRVYFKHAPYAKHCILKDSNFSPAEMHLIQNAAGARESDRHKLLKNKIGKLLSITQGVALESLHVDTKYLFSEEDRRRPDVYCKYNGKELVFEIQLSPLPQRYLLERHHFYKEKGIYLIWILDQFDIHGQSTMEKDIKYLNTYQNFFKLDEEDQLDHFRLVCDYKEPVLYKERSVVSPWRTKSVSLNEVSYCTNTFQIYFLDYKKSYELKEAELNKLIARKEAKEREALFEARAEQLKSNTNKYISRIKANRQNGRHFYNFEQRNNDIGEIDAGHLNSKLGFNEKRHQGKTLLNYYIATATEFGNSFLQFILQSLQIEINVNLKNDDGTSTFQEILKSKLLPKQEFIKLIFKRGYCLISEDKSLFMSYENRSQDINNEELFLLECQDQLINKDLVEMVWQKGRLLCILESAKRKQMVAFRYDNWISLGVLAVHSYKAYWEYIEPAFKYYGLWEILLEADKNGAFERKLTNFYETMPEQDFSVDEMIKELYPEIFKSS
jgi:competence CoiA-like predicted nuclease